MKDLTIRESAIRACLALGGASGGVLLLKLCEEAVTGNPFDWEDEDWKYSFTSAAKAIYEAIAPDVKASVREEMTPEEQAEDMLDMLCAGLAQELSFYGPCQCDDDQPPFIPIPIPCDEDGKPVADVHVTLMPDEPSDEDSEG